jgi:predicted nucleic acid-binding protein
MTSSVLVDTSVWVDHLRRGEALLQDLLTSGQVSTHPFIIGELACGNLTRRAEILRLLSELPTVSMASHEEVLHLIEQNRLYGKGLGWLDAHLLASAMLNQTMLWTRDRRLAVVAKSLRIASEK